MAEVEDKTVTTERTTETVPAQKESGSGMRLAVNIVWFIEAVIVTLLGLRFFLRLFGANPSNGFVDFIYNVSYPFVAPFLGMFNYDDNLANGRVEIETIFAIIVYALFAWLLVKLLTIGKR
jgi:YggT family protein